MKKQKLIALLPILIITGLFSGCNTVKDALVKTFTSTETEVVFTVNPSNAGNYTFVQKVISSDLKQQISDFGGDIGNIKSIKINECVFDVVSEGRNFEEFQSFDLFLGAGTADPAKVAWIDNIPENAVSQTLTLSDQDYKDVLNEDSYTLTVKGVLDKKLETALTIKAKIKYSVKVGLI